MPSKLTECFFHLIRHAIHPLPITFLRALLLCLVEGEGDAFLLTNTNTKLVSFFLSPQWKENEDFLLLFFLLCLCHALIVSPILLSEAPPLFSLSFSLSALSYTHAPFLLSFVTNHQKSASWRYGVDPSKGHTLL